MKILLFTFILTCASLAALVIHTPRGFIRASDRLKSIHTPRGFIRASARLRSVHFKDQPRVRLIDSGEDGFVAEKGKGGWYSVVITDQDGIAKVRLYDIKQYNLQSILHRRQHFHNKVVKARSSSFSYVNGATSQTITPALTQPLVEDEITPPVCLTSEQAPPLQHIQIIEAPKMHKACERWILFSDLHVKSSTIDSCETVLATVHNAAIARNAGIIFLGDFWHVRGSLSVELLNRVLHSLGNWTVPVIMIPGNHDQVTLGGAIHALEPLRYVYPIG